MIRGLARYDGSLLQRKLRGPMADWDMNTLMLRQVEFAVRAGNWQRSGGKGRKPEPIKLPDSKTGAGGRMTSAEVVQKLQNLGYAPATPDE